MHGLGELESAVMDVLWRADGPVRVRDVRQRLDVGRTLAYTTVMTVLDNLHRKGWVRRELAGKAYRYATATSREEAAARALREVIDGSGDPDAVLLHFARSVSEHESSVLRAALEERRDER
ncbi:BlaI/MecI/CopY family transcriptional regulator [Pseudonocardia acaciae]|uniref:BlaI/MecI/CopY family transcriptional regulator n=1 Tax=Pseudonocardia acaciae TaxID=551276 RepID=UPI000490425C|nr:BlaI/MecI/CopY family transcriptional regulator [Pseudonocardia acaciae]